jgi:hypothetical protein
MNIEDVPDSYKKQFCLFVRDYKDGYRIARRYLNLVTSEAYRGKRPGTKKTEIPTSKYLTSDRAKQPIGARKRGQIIDCIATNPGISLEGIIHKTGIKKAVVRQHTSLLIEEGHIREKAEGAEGIEGKIYFIKGNANDYRNR